MQDRANLLVVRRGSGIRYDGDLEAFMRAHSVGLYRDKAVDNRFGHCAVRPGRAWMKRIRPYSICENCSQGVLTPPLKTA